MKALVIEDDPNLAKVIASWLMRCGYEVTVTGSIVEAERLIEEASKLEVITLDLNLSDSTRDLTIPRIKVIREKSPDALLVVISGVATKQDEELVRSLGADGLLEKHRIPTEKTFWSRLHDVVSSLIQTPQKFQRNAEKLEAIALRIANRFHDIQ